MKILLFEGEPEEFKAVAHLFNGTIIKEGHSVKKTDPVTGLRQMLKRIPIPEGQLVVYRALANGRLEHSDFLNQIQRKSVQLAGIFGALGRRINKTTEVHEAGLTGTTKDVLTWENDGDKWFISLTPNALEALKAEGIIS